MANKIIMDFIRKEKIWDNDVYIVDVITYNQIRKLVRKQLEDALKSDDVIFRNLQLTSDGRIIPKKIETDKNMLKYKNGRQTSVILLRTPLSSQGFIQQNWLVDDSLCKVYNANTHLPALNSTGIIVAVHKKTNEFAFVGGLKRGDSFKPLNGMDNDRAKLPISGCELSIILDESICYNRNGNEIIKQLNKLGTDFTFKKWGDI